MWRLCVPLRCIQKGITTTTSLDAALLSKVLCPTTQASELASLAADVVVAMRQLNVARTAAILALFSERGVRHEELMFTGFWKVFKADWPVPSSSSQVNDGLMRGFAACTAAMFRLMLKEGFVHDHQLLAIGLGRCVECAPQLPFRGLVDVYEGISLFDRKYFSLAEVALYTGNELPHQLEEESGTASSTLLSSQPNIVDVLCGELESRLNVGFTEGCEEVDSADVVRLLKSLAVVGVVDANTLSSVRKVVEFARISVEGILDMLVSVHQIHTRVVDVLDHDGDDAWMLSERSALVRRLVDGLMATKAFDAPHRCHPQLVLRLRQIFETHPALAEEAPGLWDAVRSLRVAHKHAVELTTGKNGKHAPLGGALFRREFAVKVQPIVADRSEAERFVPPQFKTWRGSAVKKPRDQRQAAPRKVGFGTRRISRNYIKMKRKKFAPAVW